MALSRGPLQPIRANVKTFHAKLEASAGPIQQRSEVIARIRADEIREDLYHRKQVRKVLFLRT